MMRKKSNLNPNVNKKPKPNIRKAFCVICSHDSKAYQSDKRVDCIDNICIPCRKLGNSLKTYMNNKTSPVKPHTCTSQDCENMLYKKNQKTCGDCRAKIKKQQNQRTQERIKLRKLEEEILSKKNSLIGKDGIKKCFLCDNASKTPRAKYCDPCSKEKRREAVRKHKKEKKEHKIVNN